MENGPINNKSMRIKGDRWLYTLRNLVILALILPIVHFILHSLLNGESPSWWHLPAAWGIFAMLECFWNRKKCLEITSAHIAGFNLETPWYPEKSIIPLEQAVCKSEDIKEAHITDGDKQRIDLPLNIFSEKQIGQIFRIISEKQSIHSEPPSRF